MIGNSQQQGEAIRRDSVAHRVANVVEPKPPAATLSWLLPSFNPYAPCKPLVYDDRRISFVIPPTTVDGEKGGFPAVDGNNATL